MHGSYSTPVLPPVFEQAPQHLPPTHSTAALTLQLPPAQGPPRASKLGHRLSSKTPHSKSAASLHARPSASQFALLDPHALMEQPQLAQHESLKEMQIQLERAKVEADTTNELVLNEMVEAVARCVLTQGYTVAPPSLDCHPQNRTAEALPYARPALDQASEAEGCSEDGGTPRQSHRHAVHAWSPQRRRSCAAASHEHRVHHQHLWCRRRKQRRGQPRSRSAGLSKAAQLSSGVVASCK